MAFEQPLPATDGRATMTHRLRQSRQFTVFMVGGLLLLAVPAGFSLAGGLSGAPTTTGVTPTPPQILNLTQTPTDTPTPTPDGNGPTSDGNGTSSDGNATSSQRLVVASGSGAASGVASEEDCPNAEYATIQAAIDDATSGDTVVVCAGRYEEVEVPTRNLTIRADGHAVIESVGGPAIRINAPRVTISGFTTHAVQANHTIEAGGRETLIRDMTVNATDVGLLLSDGRTAGGDPNPELEAATRSRIVNSTFEVGERTAVGVWADADRTVVRDSTFTARGNSTSILSTGNETVIRGNSIRYPTERQRRGTGYISQRGSRPAIKIGVTTPKSHNATGGNLIVANRIQGAPHDGIRNRKGSTRTIIRNNTISNTPTDGILVEANDTLVENNTVTDAGNDGVVIGWFGASPSNVSVIGNTVRRVQDGVTIGGTNATVIDNTLQNNRLDGVDVLPEEPIPSGRVLNNTLTGNDGAGIRVENMPGVQIEAHYNRIWNNGELGIHNYNLDPTDGEWPIMNATHNVWGCGGPSGGLDDPITNRTANGTGDPISAADDAGVSNVHFDPFLVRNDVTCPAPLARPTPTPTPTPAPTPTQTPPAGGGSGGTDTGGGSGTGDGGGAGSDEGDGSGDSEAPSGNGDSGESGKSATPQYTSTATPTETPTATPHPTPTPTLSPTPAVEPGFGVVTWLVGIALLGSLLAVRRRLAADGAESHDRA